MSSSNFSIKTGRFSKGLKKKIATEQYNTDMDISSDSEVEEAFDSLSTKGAGGRDVLDLSHKVSAKFNSLVTQQMTSKPRHIDDSLIDSIEDAFNQSSLTKRQKKTVQLGFDSMEKYKGSKRPMSPRSKRRTENTMKLFTNKNPDNLRFRDSSENRSIGPYPHPNVESGRLSPRSRRHIKFAEKASRRYRKSIDPEDRDLFTSYRRVRRTSEKRKLNTRDMPDFRKKKRY